jgi:hypothetical protein
LSYLLDLEKDNNTGIDSFILSNNNNNNNNTEDSEPNPLDQEAEATTAASDADNPTGFQKKKR